MPQDPQSPQDARPHHRARKRFGQHFLHDPAVIERIVAAVDPRPGDHLVEIGPGRGALTGALLERAGELDVVEIDRDLAAALPELFAGRGVLRVHCADVLRFDFDALARGACLRIVGNLPYNISTPLLFRLLAHASRIRDMHFMLQSEVVDRMVARPGSSAYGRLSVMLAFYCRVERLFGVGAGAFRPPPRVDSAVVRLVPHNVPVYPRVDPTGLAEVVARAFAQRRKTLRNSLRDLLDEAGIRAAGVEPGARPETLDLDAFAALAQRLVSSR